MYPTKWPTMQRTFSFLMLFVFGLVATSQAQTHPSPGDLYREFSRHNGGNRDWRVTDRRAVEKFEAALDHLPNSRLELQVDDLQHAIRAEVMLDRWGGHRGTINKRVRFNDHDWIDVPEIQQVPAGLRPEMLMFQDNPVVSVPLEHLIEGINVFEGDCDEAGGFGWGQWGLYSLTLRVFYDRQAKGDKFEIRGKIISPRSDTTFGNDPVVEVEAHANMGVSRIDVLASYDGYDEDGDGVYDGFHESHFQLVSGQPNEIRDHVGTLWKQPYRVTWDTRWLPDQRPKAVSLIARIQDSRGYWSVTEPVENLTLKRNDISVKLYRAQNVPEDFAVRVGDETKHCTFEIPEGDHVERATETALHLRTWHGWDGHHEPLRINEHSLPIGGKNHFYDYDLLSFPSAEIHAGENTFTIQSTTEHHMLEVLWPGPAIVARIPKSPVMIGQDTYEERAHFVVETPMATYWLDQLSGGLSRLIDSDGRDWIAFKRDPWDDYPRSASSAFRGLPNVLHGGNESGFGHPGWDQATSQQTSDHQIVSKSRSGDWALKWTFSASDAHLEVETKQLSRPYWFLYEGPIAGRFAPDDQYFASDTMPPVFEPRDYFNDERRADQWRWVYFGDSSVSRVLSIVHEQEDEEYDAFSHLGNTSDGLRSPDGMVVFGFGRGPVGIDPLLRGNHSFRIGLIEQSGSTPEQYHSISDRLNSFLSVKPTPSESQDAP